MLRCVIKCVLIQQSLPIRSMLLHMITHGCAHCRTTCGWQRSLRPSRKSERARLLLEQPHWPSILGWHSMSILSIARPMHTFHLPTTLAVDVWAGQPLLSSTFPPCIQPAASPFLCHMHSRRDLHRLHHLSPLRQTMRRCRLQRQYLEEQERAGRLRAKPPMPKAAPPSLKEQHGLPPHLPAMLADAESALAINFSRQLWGNAVPGAALRQGQWLRAGNACMPAMQHWTMCALMQHDCSWCLCHQGTREPSV